MTNETANNITVDQLKLQLKKLNEFHKMRVEGTFDP